MRKVCNSNYIEPTLVLAVPHIPNEAANYKLQKSHIYKSGEYKANKVARKKNAYGYSK